jgi:putative glutamine transport system substrate-binding protein
VKRLSWLLFVILALASCTGEQTPAATPTPAPTSTAPPPTSTPLPVNATAAARVRARGVLLVGVRYDLQPFGFLTEDGQVAGFDVDLGHELARRWLGDAQAVEFRQVRSDTAIEHLLANDVDIIIAAFTHSRGREAGADFSLPYFVDGQAFLVRAGDTMSIDDPASMIGRPVGVVAWGEATDALRASASVTLTLQTYDRFDTAVEALDRGEIDAVADMRRRLFWGARMLPGSVVVGQYTTAPVALAYAQDDAYWADLINLTLQEMVSDGTYAGLYGRWFPEAPPSLEVWPGEVATPSLSDAPLVGSVRDTIASIESRGRLNVALVADRSPFSYVDATGALAGYEVNLAGLMAERWLGDPTAVDFLPGTLEVGVEMLQTGQADLLLGGLLHTRQAELEVDFSQTIYVGGEGLMVQAGGPVVDLVSLKGQQVALVAGSGSQEVLLAAGQNVGISLVVLPQPTLGGAVGLLQEARVAAVAADRTDLLGPAYATPGLGVLPLRLTSRPLGLGLPPGDSAFRDLVNMTLQAMKADGQFDALYSVWFDDAPPELPVWPGVPYRALRLEAVVPAEG